MPQILAVDASTEVCSVAVSQSQGSISRYCDTPKSHSKVLLPLIDEVLRESSLNVNQLDALAVTCGPGSFTGIRIGMGIIQGLSYAASIPIVPVNTLETMAAQFFTNEAIVEPEKSLVITALDARMGEIYWAVYACSNEQINEVVAAQVSSPVQLIEWLNQQENDQFLYGVGHGWSVAELQTGISVPMRSVDASFKPHAEGVIIVAQKLFEQGLDSFQVGALEPVYLRNEITWQKRKRIRPQD